jgi:hypothetical protein
MSESRHGRSAVGPSSSGCAGRTILVKRSLSRLGLALLGLALLGLALLGRASIKCARLERRPKRRHV